MRKRYKYGIVVVIILVAFGAAATGGNDDDAQAAATPTVVSTTVETQTQTPSPTATREPTPTATRTATASPTATPQQYISDEAAREQFVTRFQQVADDNGLDLEVTSLERNGDRWELEYRSKATTQQGHANQIGGIAGAYAAHIDRDDVRAPSGLDVTVLEGYVDEREEIGYWYIETEWAESYSNGDMSSNEYGGRVLLTLEVPEDE